MPYLNLPPTETKALLDQGDGWVYLDVRTEAEFAAGHPAGALNLPFMVGVPPALSLNPEFLAVLKANFRRQDAKLVVGCASGMRSQKACEVIANAGYVGLVNMTGGFMGSRSPLGGSEKGWAACGLPVESGAPPAQSYETLRRKI